MKVCTTCGTHGRTVRKTRGSFLMELVLWLCFIVPGLIYSLWRVSSRFEACAACGATTLVPAESPIGRATLARARDGLPGAAAGVDALAATAYVRDPQARGSHRELAILAVVVLAVAAALWLMWPG